MFPRLEAQCVTPPGLAEFDSRLTSGLPAFDVLLGGGFVKGTTTTLLGPTGVGKTLFSLKFLASDLADVGRCMYLGFYDSPARLVAKAEAASIRLRHAVDEGRLLVQWAPSIALAVDELAARCSRRSAVTPSRVW